jgi:hypothetical protein
LTAGSDKSEGVVAVVVGVVVALVDAFLTTISSMSKLRMELILFVV